MKQGWFQPQHARILSHELRKLFEIAAKAGADSNYLVYSGGPTMVLNPKVFRREVKTRFPTVHVHKIAQYCTSRCSQSDLSGSRAMSIQPVLFDILAQ